MKNQKCVIVIPIHSAEPTTYEAISFRQCFQVLHGHEIKIVAPAGLDLDAYKRLVGKFEAIFIDRKWQSSVMAYNKLKTSRFFYNLFPEYEYLLTYELDAFVFKDELDFWCSKGYDYIGAPWFEGYSKPVSEKIIGVGNSGFSLRKISSVQHVLRTTYYKNPSEYNNGLKNLLKAYAKTPFRWLMNKTGENYTIQKNCHIHEDLFFSNVVPEISKYFTIAPVDEAVKFSFETSPEVLYKRNGYQLPMGCHAWWRYNLEFWKPFIESFGYRLS